MVTHYILPFSEWKGGTTMRYEGKPPRNEAVYIPQKEKMESVPSAYLFEGTNYFI